MHKYIRAISCPFQFLVFLAFKRVLCVLEWLVLYLDPVQTPPPLPSAVQATPPLPAPVQAPPPLPAPVQAPPPSSVTVQAPPPLPAPVRVPPQIKSKKEDDENKLSDVETEGYCDDKNPPDIITRIRTVKGQRMKDLYDNTDQVLFILSVLVSHRHRLNNTYQVLLSLWSQVTESCKHRIIYNSMAASD